MLDEDLAVLPGCSVPQSGRTVCCACCGPVAYSVVNVASCFDGPACCVTYVGLWLAQVVDLVLSVAAVGADMFGTTKYSPWASGDLCLHFDVCMDHAL